MPAGKNPLRLSRAGRGARPLLPALLLAVPVLSLCLALLLDSGALAQMLAAVLPLNAAASAPNGAHQAAPLLWREPPPPSPEPTHTPTPPENMPTPTHTPTPTPSPTPHPTRTPSPTPSRPPGTRPPTPTPQPGATVASTPVSTAAPSATETMTPTPLPGAVQIGGDDGSRSKNAGGDGGPSLLLTLLLLSGVIVLGSGGIALYRLTSRPQGQGNQGGAVLTGRVGLWEIGAGPGDPGAASFDEQNTPSTADEQQEEDWLNDQPRARLLPPPPARSTIPKGPDQGVIGKEPGTASTGPQRNVPAQPDRPPAGAAPQSGGSRYGWLSRHTNPELAAQGGKSFVADTNGSASNQEAQKEQNEEEA